MLAAAFVLFTSERAEAACDDFGDGDVGYGFVVPMPECKATWHLDVGDQFYWKAAQQGTFLRFFAEPGMLFATGEGSPVHLGSVLTVSVGGLNLDADEPELDEWQVSPRMRLRIWAHEWLTLEGVLGPTLSFGPDDGGGDSKFRPGVFGGFGPGIHGFISAFGGMEVISGDRGAEPRYVVGFNITLSGAAAGALMILYACSKSSC